MFKTIRQRFRDTGTIKSLFQEAEKLANAEGQPEPGAEHFVLSALALPDGTAHKAFLRIHANPEVFRTAIAQQYKDALQSVGITVSGDANTSDEVKPISANIGLYKAKPSVETLMQTLTKEIMPKEHKTDSSAPLLGAHVLLAAISAQYSVAARAFRSMGIDPASLVDAAKAEISAYRAARP